MLKQWIPLQALLSLMQPSTLPLPVKTKLTLEMSPADQGMLLQRMPQVVAIQGHSHTSRGASEPGGHLAGAVTPPAARSVAYGAISVQLAL